MEDRFDDVVARVEVEPELPRIPRRRRRRGFAAFLGANVATLALAAGALALTGSEEAAAPAKKPAAASKIYFGSDHECDEYGRRGKSDSSSSLRY